MMPLPDDPPGLPVEEENAECCVSLELFCDRTPFAIAEDNPVISNGYFWNNLYWTYCDPFDKSLLLLLHLNIYIPFFQLNVLGNH